MSSRPSQSRNRKLTGMGAALTIVSVTLGLIGLIPLRPRLSISSEKPFRVGDQIASFSVLNDGYLRIADVSHSCFIWRIIGAVELDHIYSRNGDRLPILSPSDTLTIPCGVGMGGWPISRIDLGIVIEYRPWPLTFLASRKVFRFVAIPGKAGQLNWYKQPPEELERALDNYLAGRE